MCRFRVYLNAETLVAEGIVTNYSDCHCVLTNPDSIICDLEFVHAHGWDGPHRRVSFCGRFEPESQPQAAEYDAVGAICPPRPLSFGSPKIAAYAAEFSVRSHPLTGALHAGFRLQSLVILYDEVPFALNVAPGITVHVSIE